MEAYPDKCCPQRGQDSTCLQCDSEQSTFSSSLGNLSPCAAPTTSVAVAPEDCPSPGKSCAPCDPSAQGTKKPSPRQSLAQAKEMKVSGRPSLSSQFLLHGDAYKANAYYSLRGSATPAGRPVDAVDLLAREMERRGRRLTASTIVPSILAELNLSPRAGTKEKEAARTACSRTGSRTSPPVRSLDFAGKLDCLTKQLLVFSYSFVAFHTLSLHFCPSLYSAVRFGPDLHTDPLLQLPHPDSLLGFFYFYMNTSIHVFVKRGVTAALIHAGLLHLLRLAIVRSPKSKKGGHHSSSALASQAPCSNMSLPSGGVPAKYRAQTAAVGGRFPGWASEEVSRSPTRSHAQVRRRMRFVSRVVALGCFLSLFVTVTAFLWGGWPAKAVGFPDIYLGSLTKKGGLAGPENLRSVLKSVAAEETLDRLKSLRQESIAASFSSRSVLQKWSLDASKGLVYYRLLVFTILGFLLDVWGTWTKVRLIREFLKPRDLIVPGTVLTVVMGYAAINLHGLPACNAKDKHWVDFHTQENAAFVNDSVHDKVNTPPVLYSVYLPMRDGVELAADVYLPKPYYKTAESLAMRSHRIALLDKALQKTQRRLTVLQQESERDEAAQRRTKEPKTVFKRYQEIRNLLHFQAHLEKRLKEETAEHDALLGSVKRLPVYLDITRYNRRTEAYWPLTMLRMWKNPRGASVNLWSFSAQQAFTANGYAVVVVDARGTGASFGERYVDLSEVEIQDLSEIVQWVNRQWFASGKIGGGGVSYDGMTGLNAAAAGGVDAVLSLFTPMHVFGDLLVPGGVICSSFLKDYAGMTYGFERTGTPAGHMLNNPWKYPLHVLLGFTVAFGTTSGVFGREGDLARAIAGHRKNWDMAHTVKMVEYYDDVVTLHNNETASAAEFGIHEAVMRKLAERNVSVYVVGGYCDSASVRGATRLYDYMKRHAPSSRSKLLLGSWTHGGRRSCSPYAGSFPCFEADLYLDAVRFFDCRLNGECWGGILEEPSVHYWQVGAEEWRTSEYYPPEVNMSYVDFHLSNKKFVNLHRLDCKRAPVQQRPVLGGTPPDVCLSPLSSLDSSVAPKCPLPTSPFTVKARRPQHHTTERANNPVRSNSPAVESTGPAMVPAHSNSTVADSSPFSLPVLLPATFNLQLSTFEHRLHDIVQNVALYWQQLQTHVELLLRQARDHQLRTEDERGNEVLQTLTVSNLIGVALVGFQDEWGERTAYDGRVISKKPVVGRLKDSFAILESDPNAYLMSLEAGSLNAAHESYVRPSLAKEIPISSTPQAQSQTAVAMARPRPTLAQRLLLRRFPSKRSPRVHYNVEYFSTTGVFSRWVIAQHPFRQAVHYGNRLFPRRVRPDFPINLSPPPGAAGESFHPSPFYLDSVHASLLSWTSGVLLENIDVVGSAWVHLQLFVKSCTDVSVFVYLEAVDVNNGYSHYVTEGKIVVSHRPVKVKEESPIGSSDTVFRSFTKSSRVPLNSAGEIIELMMPLEPVSWTFLKGHAIRLSLTGSDVDNFEPAVQNRMILPREWTVLTASAKLRLPVHHR